MTMRHIDVFAGIGGFSLAASWLGWETLLQCEIDPFCQKVLRHHFPSVQLYGDIRELDGTAWRGRVDVLTAGTPCQPASTAGRRRGMSDDRWLWPEAFRVLREIQPTWAVFENVRGITSLEQGMVFESLCSDLEANGYEVQPFCIPACAVGAPHRRDRIWIIAHREDAKEGVTTPNPNDPRLEGGKNPRDFCQDWPESAHELIGGCSGVPPTDSDGLRSCLPKNRKGAQKREGGGQKRADESCESTRSALARPEDGWQKETWLQAATRLCCLDDGLPEGLDGIAVPRWRKESLKALGNAIVPQVAYQIFRSISSV